MKKRVTIAATLYDPNSEARTACSAGGIMVFLKQSYEQLRVTGLLGEDSWIYV
jgi:hypothetical protein